ncbi:glycerophosphoryl diester phosphodiesterase membrane domain-containing protein [Listeria costaricensis]|uniref:glycerophosphoryl diester phosphodiesterase membrane domain-containing protein n=1 Tax=Listeria costaricensis TaxID=2026604 RepID=UPI000C08B732|nr:glycerophosphodiester phosphodiesterase [Listeria costaricensis]
MKNAKIGWPLSQSFFYTRYFLRDYLKIILFIQGLFLLVCLPTLTFLFRYTLRFAGLSSLTNSNFWQILKEPLSVLFLLLTLLFLLIIIYIEYTTIFFLTYHHQMQLFFTWKSFVRQLIHKAKYLFSFQLLLFLLYFILIIPLAGHLLSNNISDNIQLPNFITEELLKSTRGQLLYYGVLAVIFILNLFFLLTMPIFVNREERTIFQAMAESFRVMRRQFFRALLSIALLTFLLSLCTLIATFICLLPTVIADTFFQSSAPFVAGLSLTVAEGVLFAFIGLSTVLFAQLVTAIWLQGSGIEIPERPKHKRISQKKFRKTVVTIATLGFVFFAGANILYMYEVTYTPHTQIIAHRGYVAKGVENTIPALVAAKPYHPAYIEMDVQQTKDKQFVVMHDFNLRRLAGINKNVSDMTLAELTQLTVSADGHSAKIPSLDAYIEVAKENQLRLLIEIKPHGKESPDMLDRFVEVLKKHHVENDYMVQSLDKNVVNGLIAKKVPFKVGYIVPFNIGDLVDTQANFLVIEEFSYSDRLLEQAHQKGMDLFVWTPNTEETISRYMRADVDAIITDRLQTAEQVSTHLAGNYSFTERLGDMLTDMFD